MSYENERIMNGINRGLEHREQVKRILRAAVAAGHNEIRLWHDGSENAGTLTAAQDCDDNGCDGKMGNVSIFAEEIQYAATFHGTARIDFGIARGADDETPQFMGVKEMEIVSWSHASWLHDLM